MRRARIVDFLRALDQPRRFPRRILDGNDLVVLAVHDQGRDIELLEVLGEIGLGEGLDAFVSVLEAGLHAPEPELIQDALGDLGPRPVRAVKHHSQVFVELGAVLKEAAPQAVEHLDRQALGIGRGLQHDRRYGGEQDRFADPPRPVAPDVAGNFSASGGVAHQRGVREIERLDDGRKIVGIAVHVVSGRGLAGPAMATPVVRHYAEAVLREEKHLAIPSVRAQRPAVRECYDRAHAPLLAVDWVPSLVVVVLMCCFPHSVLVFGLRSRGVAGTAPGYWSSSHVAFRLGPSRSLMQMPCLGCPRYAICRLSATYEKWL